MTTMISQPASDDRILTIWDWCFQAYLRHGRRISFPKGTDPTKTYQWRFARSLANKIDEWEFDDDTARQFINVAVKYAKNKGLLNKGLAAFHQSNMLQVCYDELQKMQRNRDRTADILSDSHRWVQDKTAGKDPIRCMLGRIHYDAMCNLSLWYQSSKITPLYMSLSRNCSRALTRLAKRDPAERGLLPSDIELYRMRIKFLADDENRSAAVTVLGEDLRAT